jgi:hypothetical protein
MTYHGPSLVLWLEEENYMRLVPEDQARTVRHWRSGVNPKEQSVDHFCCQTDFLHLSDVPDWCMSGPHMKGLDRVPGNRAVWVRTLTV